MTGEVQQPDPLARRRAALIVGVGAVAGVVALSAAVAYQPAIERWVMEPADVVDQAARLNVLIATLAVAMSLPLVGFAAYMWHLGARVVQEGRFPPGNVSVIRPTRVLTGLDARRRGRVVQAIGIGLAVAAVGVGLVWWRLSVLLGSASG